MARHSFGGTLTDWVISTLDASAQFGAGVSVFQPSPGAVWFYSAGTAGTRYTDLLDGTGAAVTAITADAAGEIPLFSGPDGGPRTMYADANAGAGPRRLIVANDPSGDQGPQGVQGPAGPGETTVYYTAGAYPIRPGVATPVLWVGPVAPTIGGSGASDNLDFWRRTPA